jgi:ParB family transcriptional regulator, chromosome partitioning protein
MAWGAAVSAVPSVSASKARLKRQAESKPVQTKELNIMEHTHQTIMVRLSDLVDSPFNVRRHSVTSVDELAALIHSQTLLHPLTVIEQPVGRGAARRMRFGVVAGKRRRRALLRLLAQGKLGKDHEVRCDLVTPERAREISIAENSGREPMHPADEFEAFKALIDDGAGVEDVAARFGVAPLTVQRRLKLAALSPKLIALYREGGINLEQLMALTLTDDHATQERAWFEARPWERDAAALRRALTTGEVQATGNALVRFVGIGAYEAGGGLVRRDLFDSEQAGWISDPDLLRRLAAEKLGGIAELAQAEGWAWVEARVELDHAALRQFAVCEATLRRLTADESQALDEMKQREAELDAETQAMNESGDYGAAERIDLEEQDIAARRAAIQSARRVWRAEDMARAGVIVTVNREGDAHVIRGLVRDADRKAATARRREHDRPHGGKASREQNEDDGTEEGDGVRETPTGAGEVTESRLPESLHRRLAAHRTVALQWVLAGNVHAATAALTHAFVQALFGEPWAQARSALQIKVRYPGPGLASVADDLESNRAWQALEAAKLRWQERLPQVREKWLDWLAALPQDELIELLALCASLSASALPGAGDASAVAALAELAGLDMADWWEPTAKGYLNQVSKAQIVQAVTDVDDSAASEGLLAMKKGELVAEAATRLAGKRWLPQALRCKPRP